MTEKYSLRDTIRAHIAYNWQMAVDTTLKFSAEAGISPLVRMTFGSATPAARSEALLSAVWSQNTACENILVRKTHPRDFIRDGFYNRAIELVEKREGVGALGLHPCVRRDLGCQ
jgi:hypothetical protein